ncbi:hypothetical protein [Stratiformator vulcanicus]|uniref:Uncharacterized protein n=1 Tax=Stratiformator vulcanicus TaxID=2527980 RepID=A0A517QWF5_9PLAN|nr:hypothetical protein [Stratiformator vulcanicus]QDT36005.1 hypothetical protein Pan189_03600 [Stratiformator vulcanicus]
MNTKTTSKLVHLSGQDYLREELPTEGEAVAQQVRYSILQGEGEGTASRSGRFAKHLIWLLPTLAAMAIGSGLA